MAPHSEFYEETKHKLDALKNLKLQEDPDYFKKHQLDEASLHSSSVSKIKFKDLFTNAYGKKGMTDKAESLQTFEQAINFIN
jgi:hypothetical protein